MTKCHLAESNFYQNVHIRLFTCSSMQSIVRMLVTMMVTVVNGEDGSDCDDDGIEW